MTRTAAVLGTLLVLLPLAGAAQMPAPVDRAALLVEHDRLDNGSPDWYATTLRLSRHWTPQQLAAVEVAQVRRFGQSDSELAVEGATPLSPSLTADARATVSTTHRVLARHSIGGGLQYEFRPAWLLHGRLKHTRYGNADVTHATFLLEHYFSNFGALAGMHGVHAFGSTRGVAEARLSWYYADASSLGVIVSRGDEAVHVGAQRVAVSRVSSFALVGRHRFGTGSWTLIWGAHRVRQEGFHTREGATLGVQRDF